ncbi:rhodanese-like domain-containing protein [Thiohalorhabdus sp. Cl-TMA]|uniref:Rhodanese-like domain-containing protein n=1 Tax=Thiohalorhabdus methylotrophus TaxID=3242694 RepID=A0ABV4TZ41_9GAMM
MAKALKDFVTEARSRIREVDPDTAEEMLEEREGVMILDVREPDEFEMGHIPGAVNVPRGTLESAADPDYKNPHRELCRARERPILLYCKSGGRSAMATATLQDMGFEEVYNIAGGAAVWLGDDCTWEGALKEDV